jgi:hypothetical protein
VIEKDTIKSHVRGVSYFVKRFRVARILWPWHYGSKLLKCCSGASGARAGLGAEVPKRLNEWPPVASDENASFSYPRKVSWSATQNALPCLSIS